MKHMHTIFLGSPVSILIENNYDIQGKMVPHGNIYFWKTYLKEIPDIHVIACKRPFQSTTYNFESIYSELFLVVYFSGKEFFRAALFAFLIILSLESELGNKVASSWLK